jgi:hypothetical protein
MEQLVAFVLILFTVVPCSSFSAASFANFQFAPNGVCVSPPLFVEEISKNAVTNNNKYFTMRNVPGEGDCMFLAVALATAASMGLGGNNVLLRAIARETRQVVASVLETDGTLVVTGKRLVRASDLLRQASQELRVSEADYLQRLRTEGCDGGLYGGGAELTVLANVLRRPISIYELAAAPDSKSNLDKDIRVKDTISQSIVCKGIFGSSTFEDPLLSIPLSAVLQASTQPVGAYCWHLHILVVDVSVNEKHACVLLPQQQQQQV